MHCDHLSPTSQALLLTVTPAKSIRASHWKKCIVCTLLSPARSAIGSYDYLLDWFWIHTPPESQLQWLENLHELHRESTAYCYTYIYIYTSFQILCEPKQQVALPASKLHRRGPWIMFFFAGESRFASAPTRFTRQNSGKYIKKQPMVGYRKTKINPKTFQKRACYIHKLNYLSVNAWCT